MTKMTHHKPAFDRALPEKKNRVLQAGISEFSERGYERANINVIAKKAEISIGLMYKYFDTKEDLFITCMDEAINIMEKVISETVDSDKKILDRAEQLIRAVQDTSRDYATFVKLYSCITQLKNKDHVEYFAQRIESISYKAYSSFIEQAQKEGKIRKDCDPRMFAFLFDSILLTLQFSYTTDYYKERFKIYCGEDIFEDNNKVVSETLKFLESAFTFSHEDIRRLEEAASNS